MHGFNSTEKNIKKHKEPGNSSQLYWILLFIHHCLLKGSILMGAVIITVSSLRRQKLNGQHWQERQRHLKTQTHTFSPVHTNWLYSACTWLNTC